MTTRSIAGTNVVTEVLPMHELADVVAETTWSVRSVAAHPTWLLRPSVRASWQLEAVVARIDGRVRGLLSLLRARNDVVEAVVVDRLALERLPRYDGGNGHLLLGGGPDLVSGLALAACAPDESDELIEHVRGALVASGYRHAEDQGLRPIASHVRDCDLTTFTQGRSRPSVQLSTLATLDVPRSFEEYLTALPARKRSTVVRDLASIRRQEIRSEVVTADRLCADLALLDEAATLIYGLNRRHRVADHPRLARMRLEEWANFPLGDRVTAIVMRHGRLLAVTLGVWRGDVLELHEAGLTEDPEVRHDAYVEGTVYAPLRHAIREAGHEVELGMAAERAKRVRGARTSPVWMVG